MRAPRMFMHEYLVRASLVGPPPDVMTRVLLDAIHGRGAGFPHRLDQWRDAVRRVKRIAIAVDDVERTVHEVAEIEVAVDARIAIGEHQRLPVQRQARGPR